MKLTPVAVLIRTVILRLVLDRWGTLLHGEIADVDGQVMSRVGGWEGAGVHHGVRRWHEEGFLRAA